MLHDGFERISSDRERETQCFPDSYFPGDRPFVQNAVVSSFWEENNTVIESAHSSMKKLKRALNERLIDLVDRYIIYINCTKLRVRTSAAHPGRQTIAPYLLFSGQSARLTGPEISSYLFENLIFQFIFT